MADADEAKPFADARANLRDTAKWVIASAAGVLAVVIGGSSFSGIGSLELGVRLGAAIAAAVLGVGLASLIFGRAIDVIASGLISIYELAGDDRYAVARDRINAHLSSQFPPSINSLRKLALSHRRLMRQRNSSNKRTRAAAERDLDQLQPYVSHATQLCLTEDVRVRFDRLTGLLKVSGPFALLSFVVFAWSANPPKDPEKPVKPPVEMSLTEDADNRRALQDAKVPEACFKTGVRVLVLAERPGRVGGILVPMDKCPPLRVQVWAGKKLTVGD
jgi:hypothetical protein